jgi:hypothetical protein
MGMRTSLYSILCICIRLAAILFVVESLIGIPNAYNLVQHGDWQNDAWLIAAFYLASLIFGLLLWTFPGVLARLAVGKSGREVFESPISPADLQYIAFSILGLRYLLGGGYSLIYQGLQQSIIRHGIKALNEGVDASPYVDAQLAASLAANLFEIVFGAGLLFGARGLVGLLDRARTAGIPPISVEDKVADKEKS